MTREVLAHTADEAVQAAAGLVAASGAGVALKIESADIAHKTEAGGVRLNVSGETAVRTAHNEILAAAARHAPNAKIDGVLVQEMVTEGQEMLLGLSQDATFGPVLTVGLGGIFVEVLKDVAFRVVPLEPRDASLMVREVKGYPVLEGVRGRAGADVAAVDRVGRAVAALDALCALAERSLTLGWCAPEFVKAPCIDITQGRHPVVEARLAEISSGTFIANDTELGPQSRMQVITGPNMGGKSTYMRQVAIIVLLASIGSPVPATACRLGPIDAIHTRIGAADDLANAQSTFMLEMTEAAQILRSATPQSLVLMDEIGRGTSTFDGLALASGIATHLHDKAQSFTLFATHYFELTEFPANHRCATNVHVSATESGNDIVFLHEIQSGPASRSYGIQVARLAGMPAPVLQHARQALQSLEQQAQSSRSQVDLFAPAPEPIEAGPTPLQAKLAQLDPDALSPREALDALYQLIKLS